MSEVGRLLKQHRKFSSAAGLLLVLTVLLYSYLQVILVVWVFIFGVIFSYFTLSEDSFCPNFLIMFHRRKKNLEVSKLRVCPVCSDSTCTRHRPGQSIEDTQPWTDLKIPAKVDHALTEFLELVLKEFAYGWYRNLSQDEVFIDELRSSLRFLTATIFRRLRLVDLPTMIIDKLIISATLHADVCLKVKRSIKSEDDFQQIALEKMGPRLHCALYNRQAEHEYTRKVVQLLFPHILSPQALECRSLCALVKEILSGPVLLSAFDKIADPDIVNKLFLIFLDESPPPVNPDPPSPMVSILADFAQPLGKSDSCFHVDITEILAKENAQKGLFPFMQFMKKEGAVHILQFYLAVEEINKKSLRPQLSEDDLIHLHEDVKSLYYTYLAPEVSDSVPIDENLVTEIKQFVDGKAESLIHLRESTAIFRAFGTVLDLLEKQFLPLFYQCDDYFSLICGQRLTARINRNQSWKRQSEKSTFFKRGSKLTKSFRQQQLIGDDKLIDEEDLPDHVNSVTNNICEDEFIDTSPLHDLSTWRISIPFVAPFPQQDNPKKVYTGYVIDVRRLDIVGDLNAAKWNAVRKYGDFYLLDQKLREFHGDFTDVQLPPKKNFGAKNMKFLESKRCEFEDYLKRLLTKPNLRGSELLFRFLSKDLSFSKNILPDINIEKMFKSMPMKLVKERGQHLDPFLRSFLLSTVAPKPQPSSPVDDDSGSVSSEKLNNPLYENNADSVDSVEEVPEETSVINLEGIFDVVLFVAQHVYHVPLWFHHVLLTAQILGKHSLENLVDYFIGVKLDQVSEEHRIEGMIHLLRDVLFFDNDPPRTPEERKQRKRETFQGLLNYLSPIQKVVGPEEHVKGTSELFDIVQQPKLNKQLMYTFLDILLKELFPELEHESLETPS